MKVLLIEDNADLSANVQTFLDREGHLCECAASFEQALDKLSSHQYDVVVLDLMLPDGNGLDLLRAREELVPETPILIVSARTSLEDRVKGLDLGADDYLTKPFHLPELNARLKALYRRTHFLGNREIQFEEIRLNPETYEAFVHDKLLNLTPKEYELLVYFLANKNRVLTKQTIAEHLWGDGMDLMDNFDFVYQHIKNLRKKITQSGGRDYISNLYGIGYKFNTSKA
ncbi:response regulator transcription factor [Pontibacter sp. G13]|uniref:response regulator transcription factor n=1 Tax=Pontibacter sp. G13 TaxID=3074898 RepID=UPI002889B8D3|nr:response regulator transcription factor [Pontibacter sp. G13]WNJ19986.1 response regulator transcription factor [Pontibacter sp. G13]